MEEYVDMGAVTPVSNSEVECSICGRNGGPFQGCGKGCNGDTRYVQPRQYTLSEIRAGRAPREDRYGDNGAVGPKTEDPLWSQG